MQRDKEFQILICGLAVAGCEFTLKCEKKKFQRQRKVILYLLHLLKPSPIDIQYIFADFSLFFLIFFDIRQTEGPLRGTFEALNSPPAVLYHVGMVFPFDWLEAKDYPLSYTITGKKSRDFNSTPKKDTVKVLYRPGTVFV